MNATLGIQSGDRTWAMTNPRRELGSRTGAASRWTTGAMFFRIAHRLLACLLAGVVLFAAVGVVPTWQAVPSGPAGADGDGEWFPCKGHHCGCLNAEMCRAHCCCHKSWQSAPSPPARSCCTHKADHTDAFAASCSNRSERSITLIIQTAGCAGRDLSWGLTALAWIATSHPVPVLRPPTTPRHELHVSQLRSQCGLQIDPPPPRLG